MGNNLPKRLIDSPLIASTAEIRFAEPVSTSVLLAKVYATLGADYGELETLPAANLPENVRSQNPQLTFLPHYAIKRADGKAMVQFGPKVFVFAADPHLQVVDLGGEYLRLLRLLHSYRLLNHLERIGLRYVNFFKGLNVFEHLSLNVSIAGDDLSKATTTYRAEIKDGDFVTGLMVASNANVQRNSFGVVAVSNLAAPETGSILDIDVSSTQLPAVTDTDVPQRLSDMYVQAHDIAKQIFFKVLTPSFVETLKPEY